MIEIIRKFGKTCLLLVAFLFSFESIHAVDEHSFIVVVDAGHGGKDPGAVHGKDYEKNINLQVALALGDLIEKNKLNVKVIFTRNKDVYLTLQERADVANNAHADLFISIHTNANNNAEASGTETYTLGLTKSKSNLDVAMRENSVILLEDDYKVKYAGFDPNSEDSYIMFECIQDRYLDKSVQFASTIQKSFVSTGRLDRGVRQAGFWVLHKTAMPSVLVEVGYLSNKDERKFLLSDDGQNKMASAIYESFDDFVKEYERKSGNQNYSPSSELTASTSNKATEKPPVKEVIQISQKEEPIIAMTKEEETQTQQFLDKMKAEAKIKEKTIVEKPTPVPTPAPTLKIEPIIEVVYTTQVKPAYKEPTEESIPEETEINDNEVVFKLQLFALSKQKPLGDPIFKGLKLSYYIEDGLYKYTYGRTKDFEKIKAMKKQIASKFPSIIVAFKNDKKVPLNEVLRK